MSVNCLDRHCQGATRNKAAIIWEGDDGSYRTFTYQQLSTEVNRFANVMRKNGVKRGDVVTMYLQMIPELAIAMLACTRIGAIHSVVFGGFSSQSLKDRIQDCKSAFLVTQDNAVRGGKTLPQKANADVAVGECPTIKNVFVVHRAGEGAPMTEGRDLWWHQEMKAADIKNTCEPEQMDAEDPLFILYTSGSTGKPKGVVHTTGGYALYTNLTFSWIFDYHPENIHFCTADIGWVTGHSYIVYGPLSNGATSVMFEGVPTYPDAGRFWEIVEKHRVSIFYTAPTAIRALMREGEKFVEKHDLSSLRLLGSVGEPINPEAWMWYHTKHRQGEAADRRHLVADRDRRHPDHAAAGRDDPQARLGQPAVPRRRAEGLQGRRDPRRQGRGRQARHREALARHAARHLRRRRGQADQGGLLLDVPRRLLHRRRRPGRR